MSTIKKTITGTGTDNNLHKGYNEKNPTQPQGAFKADSMDTKKTAPATTKPGRRKKASLR